MQDLAKSKFVQKLHKKRKTQKTALVVLLIFFYFYFSLEDEGNSNVPKKKIFYVSLCEIGHFKMSKSANREKKYFQKFPPITETPKNTPVYK